MKHISHNRFIGELLNVLQIILFVIFALIAAILAFYLCISIGGTLLLLIFIPEAV